MPTRRRFPGAETRAADAPGRSRRVRPGPVVRRNTRRSNRLLQPKGASDVFLATDIEPGDHALFLALRYIRFATARRVTRAAMTARSRLALQLIVPPRRSGVAYPRRRGLPSGPGGAAAHW